MSGTFATANHSSFFELNPCSKNLFQRTYSKECNLINHSLKTNNTRSNTTMFERQPHESTALILGCVASACNVFNQFTSMMQAKLESRKIGSLTRPNQ